jgi:hypothetical protein
MDILKWIITSSADPEKTSLAFKGILVMFIPFAVSLLGIDADMANTFVGGLVGFVNGCLTVISAVMVVVGATRKLYYARWAHPNALY